MRNGKRVGRLKSQAVQHPAVSLLISFDDKGVNVSAQDLHAPEVCEKEDLDKVTPRLETKQLGGENVP
ncbi:hypothetical protein L2E82_09871 [Cichorium intybus]|uniref:Uncharacterized protein n=1 Tax=Cichorium intybus TaxID=13427 RepID=A0ACB9GAI6_CICIN|nr:hypothetical protein L2E82_09871 [Cichorium intybus]